ncbi:MAG: molecular chaperone HtpG [Chitinispirillales bacterium]|jgi:molecular chaperone HtpG|nr:molecular chaperone HtpG [Chitinispirillales bacterium]
MQSENTAKKMEFQAEAKQLLRLMIHSLYSHKEVFLRELISNASDALDKLRFDALTNRALGICDSGLAVRIKADKEAKTITISDNGIGMSRREVIENIGTIARSGSKAFLEKMTGDQKLDSNLIGQFGVGFYSVFMVANRVQVITRRAGSDEGAVMWESDGESSYTLTDAVKDGHGTEVIIYLKEDEGEFAQDWQVRSLVKKYSDFIAFPIYMPDKEGKEEVVNQTKPLWRRAVSEVTAEQYDEFYAQALGGFGKPLSTLHTNAEGVLEYSSLIFIPAEPAFDLFSLERKHGVKLYVKRVFIMDNCKELLPEYLRFVRGIIDSEDLPLNVSREMLQKNAVMERMSKALVSKILGKLKELAENDPKAYGGFWKNFGVVIKEGLHTDYENREKLLELLRFQSSMGDSADDLVSLKQYVDRMREDQKDIYYITGESRDVAQKSPHLEVFRAKSIEVLYLVDPIDEWVIGDMLSYGDKQLRSVTKGDLDLGELGKEEADRQKAAQTEVQGLSERIKEVLADMVEDVRATGRLKDSPACLVAGEHAMGAHLEKIMKAMGQNVPKSKKILEINADHAIIKNMNVRYEKDSADPELEQWALLLYEGALIAEGQMVPDPLGYSRRVNDVLAKISAS